MHELPGRHFAHSRTRLHPSSVTPHSTLSSSQDFGAHDGEVEDGVSVSGAKQWFVVVSHFRSSGHGHVLVVKSMLSAAHAKIIVALKTSALVMSLRIMIAMVGSSTID